MLTSLRNNISQNTIPKKKKKKSKFKFPFHCLQFIRSFLLISLTKYLSN